MTASTQRSIVRKNVDSRVRTCAGEAQQISSLLSCCFARNTITFGNPINSSGGPQPHIVSSAGKFALGFFTPNGTSHQERLFVGIWFHGVEPRTVVWVANRDRPVSNSTTWVFGIGNDGNLMLSDRSGLSKMIRLTNLGNSAPSSRTLKLMDSGNLLLSEDGGNGSESRVVWESFLQPTDTFLPGMKITESLTLTSWTSQDDPATGVFSFRQDGESEKQYMITKKEVPYWKSGLSDVTPCKKTGSRKTCGCGTNVIPYPLSTGPSCGDPMYLSFNCQNETDTGQMSFNVSGGGAYRVTSINPETQKFSIQVNSSECRSSRNAMEKLLQLPAGSPPFFVSSPCNPTRNNFSIDSSSEELWFYEVEIGWKPPPEPICNKSSEDCRDWPNSSCKVASDGTHRCLCNKFYQWNSSNVMCTLDIDRYMNQRRGPFEGQKPTFYVFIGVTASMLFVLYTACALYQNWRRRIVRRQGNLELSLSSERRVIDFINSVDFKENDKTDIDVPHFSLESILVATDNFAEANKLGQGGFGPVYKGKLPRGREIAIKRLSRGSGQGLEEFKNEVVLIAKLQHRNLVRLLGYHVKGYEKMLIYEYMPNKSLDSFIFDRTRSLLLNWEKRIDIIFGIARGMLYLHQDSRLRIIHRDLKTSNILLDEEMNPKISDFGLARIFGGKQTEASTERVIGTYGYMSPEYALDGFFSIKSDVFSFGVVLLETISGKRNTGFYQAEQPLSLLGYTWKLWIDDRALDLAEQAIRETCNPIEFIRFVNVGLLCVQEDPSDRPTMSNVLFMLGSETAILPAPKRPAFVVRRSILSSGSSSDKQQWDTSTLEEGR
ncbi:hypothetical protein COLO4_13054 [Corchorus olitorius]|uniref:Receptor-like serine/threonine-protein kinase n=1 Tax=Corchorus olitorius TaxID=93759 RepID=A0A1R3JYH2_9ROSI|nr:hypothetical protein COLO4_13054 [Corchorus olitorius]